MDYGDTRLPAQIWDALYPEPNTGCWLWSQSTSKTGYGQVHWDGTNRERARRAA